MSTTEISIIDCGRGAQLSTGRITVQDLVPYFQCGCSYEEIRRWIPSLTREEIAVVEAYYHNHREELEEEDQRIRAYRDEQIRAQRSRFPEEDGKKRLERMRRLLKERTQETNGVGNSG